MPSHPLTGKPLLILGPAELANHIKTHVLSNNAPLSLGQVEHTEDYDTALRQLQTNEYAAVLLPIENEPGPATNLFLQKLKDRPYAPLIAMCDLADLRRDLRVRGTPFCLPLDSFSQGEFFDILYAAYDYFKLHSENAKLRVEAQEVNRRFEDVAEHFADWLWEVDLDGNLVFSSSRKRPAQNAEPGQPYSGCFLPDEKTRIEDDFSRLKDDPKPFYDREYWSYDAYGTRLCWNVSGVPVHNNTGDLIGFRGIARDISSQKASSDQLYNLSNNDLLTGVYNRGRFHDELNRMARLAAKNDKGGALVAVDIDRFNYVNESFGHEYGDKLLVHCAQILKDHMRAIDFIARSGSNEFSLILPDVEPRDLEYRIRQIRDALNSRPLQMEKGSITFSVSIGAVLFPQHGRTADELLAKIGQAVQLAKQKGRNRAEVLKDSDLEQPKDGKKLEWLDFVAKCLAEPEERVVLHFQPIVPLSKDSNHDMYEVLVRMRDDQGEIVSPFKFIDTAEEFGMIGKIDAAVLMRVIDLQKRWLSENRKTSLSVNISCRTFDDDEALEQMKAALKEAQLPPGSIVLEITETSLLRDLAHVQQVVVDFKQLGVLWALDDCGVGYSSLNYIRELALDYIKIDGTFIRNMHRNKEDTAFVNALHHVAKEMGIQTVAEMVENEAILKKLEEIGLDYAQGYFFAVPGPDVADKKKLN